MDKLPSTIIQHIYEYDNIYKIRFGKVLNHCLLIVSSLIATNASSHGMIVIAIVSYVKLTLNTANKYFTMKRIPMKMSWNRLLLYRDDLNITYLYLFVLLGWFNFILKEWLTISRGAEPYAQNQSRKLKKDKNGENGIDIKTLLQGKWNKSC